jgi:hypothetical protein
MQPSDLDAIDILIHDHDLIKSYLAELVQAEVFARDGVIERLKPLLTVHNATEENLVYGAIHGIAKRPIHARTLYHQQDDSEVSFWEVSHMKPEDPEFFRKSVDLRDAVFAHIRQEEEHDFPHLREALTPEEAHKLNDEVRAFRRDFRSVLAGRL